MITLQNMGFLCDPKAVERGQVFAPPHVRTIDEAADRGLGP